MYDMELEKVIENIKINNYKRVLVQLPDGLKPKAKEIVDAIRKDAVCEVFIWFGNCFGACDTPLGIDNLNIDLVVQWGHNKFNKEDEW